MNQPPKPWSVDIFQEYRPHLCEFVNTKIAPMIHANECRRLQIRAPVKSGKREIAEYTALRDLVASGSPTRVHAFVSAWHRKADDEQRDELAKHNLYVSSITNREEANKCNAWIFSQINLNRSIVVHLDECDHGSGSRQILGQVWREIRDHPKVTTILYSATPEEVLYSSEVDQDADFMDMLDEMGSIGYCLRYEPIYYNPSVSLTTGFCGPAAFLDADLIEEATPFFRKRNDGGFELTSQGRRICTNLLQDLLTDPNRNLLVLRLSYSELKQSRNDRKSNKAIYQFLRNIASFPELANFQIVVDKGENFEDSSLVLNERIQWDNPMYWRGKATNLPTILVLDQTSTRSTEWLCHNRIHTVHDFRNALQFGTNSQALERVNHYANKYGGFQRIRVFGNKKTFELSAGRISYETYLTNEWYSRKVDRRRTGDVDVYEIRRTNSNALHPRCAGGPLSREESDEILQELGCFAIPSLSMRIKGSIRMCAIVQATFHPCDSESFQDVVNSQEFQTRIEEYNPRNPFLNARMQDSLYMDDMRGEYKVWQFSDIKDQTWGFNATTNRPRIMICYDNGILGIALRTLEGFQQKNTLATYRSMYRS
jgi:hypothetical protein